jgi:hypothetical protein
VPVEELALDGASLEHPPLPLVELVEPRREQRPQGRRHLRALTERGHLGQEQRIAAGRANDALARLVGHRVSDERAGVVLG